MAADLRPSADAGARLPIALQRSSLGPPAVGAGERLNREDVYKAFVVEDETDPATAGTTTPNRSPRPSSNSLTCVMTPTLLMRSAPTFSAPRTPCADGRCKSGGITGVAEESPMPTD